MRTYPSANASPTPPIALALSQGQDIIARHVLSFLREVMVPRTI